MAKATKKVTKKTVKKTTQEVVKKIVKKPKEVISVVGRRKKAIARLRLFKGNGKIIVNGKPIEKYFYGKSAEFIYLKPLKVTEMVGKYDATIKVSGSGLSAQMGAVVHALARALDKTDNQFHTILKKNKLLTRDPRSKERSKPGQMGRARKKKQSPKR